MTTKKQVSEKSLELNICAELLQCIRARKGCERAVWYGMTQLEERRYGLDEMLGNSPGYSLMLQFKAPETNSKPHSVYKFKIDMRQHDALMRIARLFPKTVYYAFPFFSEWSKISRRAPTLLEDTWLLPVSCMPIDPSDARKTFILKFDTTGSSIKPSARGLDFACTPINATRCCAEGIAPLTPDSRFVGLPSRHLREWVEVPEIKGMHFRALNALHLPDTPIIKRRAWE